MTKYASEIKKTADGRGRGSCRQARRNKEVEAQRRFQTDGKVDEQKAAQRIRQHETKESSKKEALKITRASL